MKITCYVGKFHPHQDYIPPDSWRLGDYSVTDYFAHGSTGRIDLTINTTDRIDRTLVDDSSLPAASYDLNKALNVLIGNGRRSLPILESDTVGLILADESGDESGLFGLMFNGMFKGTNTYAPFHRQGAAIFVETIRKHRTSKTDFDNQIVIDVIHELGHVFNLWHSGTPQKPTLMTPSDLNAVHQGPYEFSGDQIEFLSHWDDNYVRPGGSEFRDRGDLQMTADDQHEDHPRREGRLKLTVCMTQEEFWPFEPVELDLRIELDQKCSDISAVTIPNEVDPGYGRLRIWITEPNGNRRLYRPTAWLCGNARQLRITRRRPFQRDVTIFGESGGYTFRLAGRYQIQACLRLGWSELQSNVIEISVLPPASRDSFYQQAAKHFRSDDVAHLLFYRDFPSRFEPVTQAMALTARYPRQAASAGLFYALGRSFLRRAHHPARKRRQYQRMGIEYIERALESGRLFGHRSEIAERLLVR